MPERIGLTFITAGFSGVLGIACKIFWDYLKAGRVEKTSIYMTTSACQHIREHCQLGALTEHVSKVHTDLATFKVETRSHQKETDKRLSENNHDIRAIRGDITEIKEGQSHSNALLENIAETIKRR